MPLAEKGVRGKGRQPLSPPQHVETGARIARRTGSIAAIRLELIGFANPRGVFAGKIPPTECKPFQRQFLGVSSPTTNIPYFSFGFGRGESF